MKFGRDKVPFQSTNTPQLGSTLSTPGLYNFTQIYFLFSHPHSQLLFETNHIFSNSVSRYPQETSRVWLFKSLWPILVTIHTCLLLLISMLWHRQAIFEYIHTYIHTYIQTDRQTDRQTDMQTDTHKHTHRQTDILLLISMLRHRQAIFESKEEICLALPDARFEPNLQQTEWLLIKRLNYRG